eukprot:CAMPEP_0171460752 /NCGR_PEP_ID=MMETSP0945-20130129/5498_1 /TAXON_ID=109269 /ORGANISM="Vaucheria litorea, Strain CCMP2940" /LENGTH=532 /DNA_ID=CAMNT_0011987009 /DNA_START=318 /DNA_END=1916 /DNA_ORIENTATION=+
MYFTSKSPKSATSQAKPNIIFIFSDDLGYNDVGWAMDDFKGITPNLDNLKKKSIELENYYTQHICTPARAALLTGRYPYKTGMQASVIFATETWGLPLEFKILPQYLNDFNYQSFAVGKWNLGHSRVDQLPQSRGFDKFYGYLTSDEHYYSHTNLASPYVDFMDGKSGNTTDPQSTYECVNEKGKYSANLHTNRALEYIDEWEKSEEKVPTFLYLAFQNPHYPLEPSNKIDYSSVQSILDEIKDPDRQKAARLVYSLDIEVKRVYERLESSGMMDNSILVFAGDNGGCPKYGTSSYPLRGTKGHTFEGGTKVRSFIYSPLLKNKKNEMYKGLFHVTDWVPTLMDAVSPGWSGHEDLGLSYGLDGKSHWKALLSGNMNPGVRNQIVYNVEFLPDMHSVNDSLLMPRGAIRKGDWKLIMNEECQVWEDIGGRYSDPEYLNHCYAISNHCSIYASSFKASSTPDVKDWLFNIREDPYETTNRIHDEPEILEDMKRSMHNLVTETYPRVSIDSGSSLSETAYNKWEKHGCISPWLH